MSDFELSNGERQLKSSDFLLIEEKIGFSIPEEVKKIYFLSNGGDPMPNTWIDPKGKWEDIEIRDFFPFLYKADQKDDGHFTAEGIALKGWRDQVLPKGLLPFAIDWGGNYFCLDLSSGKILYFLRDLWDDGLSLHENFAKSSRLISDSFSEFIKSIQGISG